MRASIAAVIVLFVLGSAAPTSAQGLSSRDADPADVQTLDGIIAAFYDIVSGPAGEPRDWARDSTLYRADVRFAFQVGEGSERRWQTVDHAAYVRQAGPFLERGFFEREIHRVVQQFGGMAQVFSTYEWTGPTESGPQRGRGINSIELVFEKGRWWITHAQWAEESAEHPIPRQFLPATEG